MTRSIVLAALLAALPAFAQELPPPPPPPSDDVPPERPALEPRAGGEPSRAGATTGRDRFPSLEAERKPTPQVSERKVKYLKGTIGEGPVAPAGSQVASLHPDEELGHWRFALASGVVGRWGGQLVDPPKANANVMLYFGAQADGLWTEGYGRGARLRIRMMTGGENVIFIPSDGDMEAAFMLGRREFRFVAARVEATRATALGIQSFLQAATFPSVEGSVPFAGDAMRISYFVAPVEAAWDYYRDENHIRRYDPATQEHVNLFPASAARLRFTAVAPPAVLLTVQGDFVKMWGVDDLLVSAEGAAGFAALENTVLFNISLRWDHATLRGHTDNAKNSYDQMLGMISATLLL